MMGKYHSENNSGSGSGAGVEPLVRLWLLRLLVGVEAFKRGFRDRYHRCSEDAGTGSGRTTHATRPCSGLVSSL